MTTALMSRLAWVYNPDQYPPLTTAGSAGWPNSSFFGDPMPAISTIIPHLTGGWPSRNKGREFVTIFTDPAHDRHGFGPQYYIAGDGSVARLVDPLMVVWHAEHRNRWAIGIEQGNLGSGVRTDPPHNYPTGPDANPNWIQLNQDAATQADDDVPGSRAWLRGDFGNPPEVVCAWWTTAGYTGPRREALAGTWMRFSEWDYRGIALLVRYLCEQYLVPRTVPLLPHTTRVPAINDWASFRRIVRADPGFSVIAAQMAVADPPLAPALANLTATDFETASDAVFEAAYHAARTGPSHGRKYRNDAWVKLFDAYRGLHGHGFSGALRIGNHEHDCPGPLFDWHRFAREISDYWWYPFDVDAAGATAVPRRPYQNLSPNGATPVHEYYFDEPEAPRRTLRRDGVHGPASSPETFTLEPGAPVYAMANGDLVAARIPVTGVNQADETFVLLRHEIFYQPATLPAWPGFLGAMPEMIDYAQEPTYVYTLYTHLDRGGGVDPNQIHSGNPDWLNRTLERERECALGLAFYAHPTHHGLTNNARWNTAPVGGLRPSMLGGWQIDAQELGAFLTALRAGDVAFAPPRTTLHRPLRVVLGDFLGIAGVCHHAAGVSTYGVRVEAFSPHLLPGFTPHVSATAWTAPAGTGPFALQYESEWSRWPNAADQAAFAAAGYPATQPPWWNDLRVMMMREGRHHASRLPRDGVIWHYHPFELAHWVNVLTWKHERAKYRDPAVVALARPPSRRV